jgi:hypothetical protein
MDCCGAYHTALYAKAAEAVVREDAAAFKELTFSYNHMARGLNLRDTFSSPLEFARTLMDHHEKPNVGEPSSSRIWGRRHPMGMG